MDVSFVVDEDVVILTDAKPSPVRDRKAILSHRHASV